MSAVRSALIYADAISILCPECDEPHCSPSGSQFWTSAETCSLEPRETIQCYHCSARFRFVKTARVEMIWGER